MTNPTQSVAVRRIYYASGSPSIVEPVLYDNAYDGQPNVDVLDLVLAYNGQIDVNGYTWNGTQQIEDASDSIGDALRADAKAYWKMDEVSGNRADATGRGNTLIQTNGVTPGVAGKINNAGSFDETSGRCLESLHSADLIIDKDLNFYLCTWVKINTKTTLQNGQYFLFSEDTIGFNIEWEFEYQKVPDRIVFNAMSSGVSANTFGSPPINTWLFCEIYYNTTTNKLGIAINNGVFDENTPIAQNLYNNDTVLMMGDLNYGEWPLNGYMDECFIMHRIPTQEERDYLYNGGAGRTLYP